MIKATLNVQVVPWPANQPVPGGAKLVLLPARPDEDGQEQACTNCGGTGAMPRHGDPCRRCNGTGRGHFVTALRWDAPEVEQLREVLVHVPASRRQTTIRVVESGGGHTNTGHAAIVAGLHGEPLPAVYGRPLCGEDHAVFYVHAAMIVQYRQHRGVGSGSVWLVAVGPDYSVQQVELWRFSDGEDVIEIVNRPDTSLEFPVAAVEAARRKARCYHCRSAFYAAGKGACGPNGALRGAGAAFGGMPSPFKGPGIGY
jgi:hypothetical protein